MTWTIDRRTALAGGLAGLFAGGIARGAIPVSDPEWVARLLTVLHPGLYRYQTPAEFRQRHARFAAEWAARPSLEQRFLALSRLTAAIRCGHTYPNPHNQSDAVVGQLTDRRLLLPFNFRWLGRRMVVTADPYGSGLPPGTEVLRVDGRPAPALLDLLLPYARADGSNDDKRRALLSVTGSEAFETFDLYQPLLAPIGATVRLDLRSPSGRRWQQAVPTIDRATRLAARQSARAKPDDPLWSLTREGKLAILTMPDWSVYDSKWDWRSWLTSTLQTVASDGTTGLIIDLRANEGGQDDVGALLLAALLGRPAETPSWRRLVRFQSVPLELRPPLKTWDKGFFELGRAAAPANAGFYRLRDESEGAQRRAMPHFKAKLAVLISSTNSSATFGFAQSVRAAARGVLIGEPTGGNRRGINGGAYFFVKLPDSGLEFDLPLIGYFPDARQPDSGLIPDIRVSPTPGDLARGRDVALASALAALA